MGSVCILTDNTVQFIKPNFPGRDLVNIVNMETRVNLPDRMNGHDLKPNSLPSSASDEANPHLQLPGIEDFRTVFLNLASQYNEIVAILHSSHLSRLCSYASEAAGLVRGRVSIQVIDSLTISVGLGYMVQVAAEAAGKNAPSTEIERLMRGIIPHIYSIFCIPGLTYLYHSGFLGKAQAEVGEMLGLLPIFSLEDGRLTPLEKARNSRHLIDFWQEFLDEFSDLVHIAFIQSIPPLTHEVRTLREHATTIYPKTPFSEHPINLPLATMFGPRCSGVFTIETPANEK